MSVLEISFLALLFFITAVLYSSVGHGGASGYLAAMALVGIAPAVMKPTALVLNILVSAIAIFKFYRSGSFSWRLFWPFAITSVPAAFIGGGLTLPGTAYNLVVGLVLLYGAYRLYWVTRLKNEPAPLKPIPIWLALLVGLLIGLLSGLVGVGGGIFLSPLMLFLRWADARQTAAVAAAFILVNSISGLLGNWLSLQSLPGAIPAWALVVMLGGWIGAEYGSRRLANDTIRRLLAVVLAIAGLKMMFI